MKIPKAIIMEIKRSSVHADKPFQTRNKRKTIILTLGGRHSPFAQILPVFLSFLLFLVSCNFQLCSSDKLKIRCQIRFDKMKNKETVNVE